MTWTLINGGSREYLGFIPDFVWPIDTRPVAAQFNDRYAHGGGWMPMNGWTMDEMVNICYPGNEPLAPMAQYRHEPTGEHVFVYQNAWVAIVQPNGKFEVSRMD
jgi:hypothetical protein